MTTDEQPIIYLHPNLSVDSEPTLSRDSGAMEEGLSNNTSSSAAATATSSPHWIKRHYLTVTFAFLVLCGVVFAAVVFRPGGPGNSKSMESNRASITRGTDITTPDGDGEFAVRPETDAPTYYPTYAPTDEEDDGPEEEEIDTPETIVPTPSPTLNATSTVPTPTPTLNATLVPTIKPTTFKPTFPPNLDFSFLTPTPAPMEQTAYPTTLSPTVEVTDYSTSTVSTEVTGPPTLPNRDD